MKKLCLVLVLTTSLCLFSCDSEPTSKNNSDKYYSELSSDTAADAPISPVELPMMEALCSDTHYLHLSRFEESGDLEETTYIPAEYFSWGDYLPVLQYGNNVSRSILCPNAASLNDGKELYKKVESVPNCYESAKVYGKLSSAQTITYTNGNVRGNGIIVKNSDTDYEIYSIDGRKLLHTISFDYFDGTEERFGTYYVLKKCEPVQVVNDNLILISYYRNSVYFANSNQSSRSEMLYLYDFKTDTLTPLEAYAHNPLISPDGKYLVYVKSEIEKSGKSPHFKIYGGQTFYVLNTETREKTEFATENAPHEEVTVVNWLDKSLLYSTIGENVPIQQKQHKQLVLDADITPYKIYPPKEIENSYVTKKEAVGSISFDKYLPVFRISETLGEDYEVTESYAVLSKSSDTLNTARNNGSDLDKENLPEANYSVDDMKHISLPAPLGNTLYTYKDGSLVYDSDDRMVYTQGANVLIFSKQTEKLIKAVTFSTPVSYDDAQVGDIVVLNPTIINIEDGRYFTLYYERIDKIHDGDCRCGTVDIFGDVICIYDADTNEIKLIADYVTSHSFSPDNKYIAYTHNTIKFFEETESEPWYELYEGTVTVKEIESGNYICLPYKIKSHGGDYMDVAAWRALGWIDK